MRYKLLSLVILLLVSVTFVNAQAPARPNILVAVDNSYLASFAPGNPTANPLGDLSSTILPDDSAGIIWDSPVPAMSPDGQWVVFTAYSPGAVVYGRTGTRLSFLPNQPSAEYQVMWTTFSPDSRYLSYTMASYEKWLLRIVELASGRIIQFTGFFATIEPQLDKNLPFGNMVPNVVKWGADGTTLYLETYIPFWGCRGPHDLYTMSIAGINFDERRPALPPVREVTTLGDDIYSFVFSPDNQRLAYAYHDENCSAEGPHSVGLVNLATGENSTIVATDETQIFTMGDWTLDSHFLLYSSAGYDASSARVFLYDTGSGQSGEMIVSNTPEDGYDIEAMQTGANSLFSILRLSNNAQGLYSGTLSDGQVIKNYLVAALSIDWLRCENTLFYVAHNDKAALYSQPLNDGGTATLLLEAEDIELLTCGI